jgi:hypothetical protein
MPALKKKYARELREAEGLSEIVVARVGGEEILLSDMARIRAELSFEMEANSLLSPSQPFVVTDELVVQRALEEKVVWAEAKKRNLLPTETEVQEYVDEMIAWQKKTFEEFRADPTVPDDERAQLEAEWDACLSGWGVSEAAFWTGVAPRIYARWLVPLRLERDEFGPVEDFDFDVQCKREYEWSRFVEGLVLQVESRGEVEVIEPEFFKYDPVVNR